MEPPSWLDLWLLWEETLLRPSSEKMGAHSTIALIACMYSTHSTRRSGAHSTQATTLELWAQLETSRSSDNTKQLILVLLKTNRTFAIDAPGCRMLSQEERRTNYFFLSFLRKSDLSSSGKRNYQATASFPFWQVVLYPTQVWGNVLIPQHRDLHALLNRNTHSVSDINDGTQQKLLFPPPMHMLSGTSINRKYILYKNNSHKTRTG